VDTAKLIIYPYSFSSSVFARFYELIPNQKIICGVAPGYCVQNGIDAAYYDEGEPTGVPIFLNFYDALEKCDIVLWAEYNYEGIENFKISVVEKIIYAIQKGKHIKCVQKIEDATLLFFYGLAKKHNVNFEYFNNETKEERMKKIDKVTRKDIMTIANKFKLDTIFFLEGGGNNA